MKGNNEFRFNEATMIEAMQEYLDRRMGAYTPTVASVKYKDVYFYVVVRTEEKPEVAP